MTVPRYAIFCNCIEIFTEDLLMSLGITHILNSKDKSLISFMNDIKDEMMKNIDLKSVNFKYDKTLSYEFLPKKDFDLGNAQ